MKLPNFLFKKVKEHNTSLGDNEAFPPREDYPFDYKVLKQRYNEVLNNLSKFNDIENTEENYLISLFNKLMKECKEKEKPIKNEIEKLCLDIVNDVFNIPQNFVIINIDLVDKLTPKQKYQITPQDASKRNFNFNNLDDFSNASKAIMKRRLINSLILGASYEYSTKTILHIDEITSLLSDLKPLYERIIAINDFLLFNKKDVITDKKTHQGACVEVMLGNIDEKTEINVQGLIFPFLLMETFRGLFELFASHGLPTDKEKAKYIINQSDFLLAEPWDLRFGVPLWNIISENVNGYESMPFFFMSLCELGVEDFNSNLKEVFAKTNQGAEFISFLNKKAIQDCEINGFNGKIELEPSSDDENIINDSYITADELDSYYLTDNDEEINDGIIEEGGNTPNKIMYNGKILSFEDVDAYPFFVVFENNDINVNIHPSPTASHSTLLYDLAAESIGFDSFRELLHFIDEKLDGDERDEYMNNFHNSLSNYIDNIKYEGRYWYNDEVIAFWNITPSCNMLDIIFDEISKELEVTINNPKIIIGNQIIDYIEDYNYYEDIVNDSFKSSDEKTDEELRNIHLMNQQDKREALTDFRQNRNEVQGKKLGKIPMAQYHNMIYQESIDNKSQLLKEGLYDNFDVRDADKICYNYYEEDFGDEEEPDIQNLYNIQVWDMFSNLIYENDDLNTDELEELLGVDIASKIYNNEGVSNNDEYYPYCLMDFNPHIFGDANETARFIFRDKLTDYFPNLHGFILKDGMCIDLTNPYGNYDHSLVSSSVPQLNNKLDFVAIGNIRCSINSFDLIHPPTKQQKYTLRKLIANSNNLIVDIYSEDTKDVLTSAQYRGNPNPSYVLGEIDRFFNEGINLKGGYSFDGFDMYESLDNTNKSKKIYINESQLSLLTESQESKSISAAKKLLMQRLGYDGQQADEFIRVKLRNDLPVLRTPEGGKFILGVTRMFVDGELINSNVINDLNSTLKLVASDAHINEYDRNLNGMTSNDLISRFAQAISDNLNAEKEEINQMVFDTPSDYEIVRIDSFEQAQQYGKYTSWCVTHDGSMFNSYTSDGINQFYFCLKNGFEHVENIEGEGCPLDEYGLSMLAISVNENGMLNTCTCRWNHSNGGNDNVMNSKEISQVIGMNFFEVFKPNNTWIDLVDKSMKRLNAGEPIYEVFDDYYEYDDGITEVELKGKCNFINVNGKLLSPNQWYDNCDCFYNDFAIVRLKNKYNFINVNGKLLSPNQWYDGYENCSNGFAIVELDGRFNFINEKGKILSPKQWYDDCYDFHNGFAIVELDGRFNFINEKGKILSPKQWFDRCADFENGVGIVRLNDKLYYINTEREIIGKIN